MEPFLMCVNWWSLGKIKWSSMSAWSYSKSNTSPHVYKMCPFSFFFSSSLSWEVNVRISRVPQHNRWEISAVRHHIISAVWHRIISAVWHHIISAVWYNIDDKWILNNLKNVFSDLVSRSYLIFLRHNFRIFPVPESHWSNLRSFTLVKKTLLSKKNRRSRNETCGLREKKCALPPQKNIRSPKKELCSRKKQTSFSQKTLPSKKNFALQKKKICSPAKNLRFPKKKRCPPKEALSGKKLRSPKKKRHWRSVWGSKVNLV